jgi:D-sedoheptulose 7-phosphate isomerase
MQIKKNLENALVSNINSHIEILKLENKIKKAINLIHKSIKSGGKILICGNGGSASDAQHLVAEFLVRLRPNVNRKPIAAMTLAQDTSTITACGNDYSFDEIFKRNFEALSKKNDVLIVITTSGNSQNILNVLKYAKKKNFISIGLLGKGGGKAKKYCTLGIEVDSKITARIQECHIFLGHFIFEQVENLILNKNS